MRRLPATVAPVVLAIAAAAAGAGSSAADSQVGAAQRQQSTLLISQAAGGGLPNGPSTNAVISNDKRYARVIAFESEASNLVAGDRNGQRDVFAVFRAGSIGNNGAPWQASRTRLISRTRSGAPANGPSFSPAVGGGFHARPRCIGFLSAASNLVGGDTNGKVDAFVSRGPGGKPKRVPVPGNRQPRADATAVAVSGDCSRIAFVSGGRLYVRKGSRTRRVKARGTAADPSFSTGLRSDLVFGASGGVYLAKNGTGRPRRIARGRNPAYNDIKRHTVAYETTRSGRTVIGYKDVGKRERIISPPGTSTHPAIGNSGYYVTFQTVSGGSPGTFLYTDTRKIAILQSVDNGRRSLPGGGANPSMSFYANYIVFDSPAPLGSSNGPRQIFMRYLGGV